MKLIGLIIGFFLAGIAFGQEFNSGLLLGFDLAELSGDQVTGPNQPGLYAGLYSSLYVSKRSSLQMELDYVQKGTRKKPDTTDPYGYSIRMHYLELHVLYHYDIKRFTLEAGPSLGYLVANPIDKLYGYEYDDFYDWDFSIGVGLYYELLKNFRLAIRYSNSILPVSDNPSGNTWTLRKGEYNEVLSFSFYYVFLHY
jgi:hypothetical protein